MADGNNKCGLNSFFKPNTETFRDLIEPKRQPAVLKGLDIGQCMTKWTPDYLSSVGGNREVKIHVSEGTQMDFINKNFLYKSLPFSELVNRASQTEQSEYFISKCENYYLRALGSGDPRKEVADIRKDFPELAEDIQFPPFFEEEQFFSSVFRIASKGIQLWTHYDIMDNMLIVVSGRKRVVLFSPRDTQYMYLNGDKSEVLDIDNVDDEKFPDFKKATRYECVLEPGDILFIPALWYHNVINEEWGVAVNVFWRHLQSTMYDHKDPYGNKDLVPGTRAIQVVDRALKILDELPQDYKDFYVRRLILRLEQKGLNT